MCLKLTKKSLCHDVKIYENGTLFHVVLVVKNSKFHYDVDTSEFMTIVAILESFNST